MPNPIKTCTVPGCGRKHKGRGLCDMHIQRQRRTGTTASPVKPQAQRFWEKVRKAGPDDCWIWTGARNEHGYGVLRPAGQHSGPGLKAHRYSAELAGMGIVGKFVLHSCDNPPCVNPAHLRPGTPAENMNDALSRNRIPLGSARRNSRLTEAQVQVIRERAAHGELHRVIAEDYGVSRVNITQVVAGKYWKHVTPPAARDLVGAVAASLN